MSTRIQRDVRRILNSTGLPYEIRPGGKHNKVYLDGRCIAVISMCRNLTGDKPLGVLKRCVRIRLKELGINYSENSLLRGA